MIEVMRRRGRREIAGDLQEKIVSLYQENDMRAMDIANVCHVGRTTVYNVLQRHLSDKTEYRCEKKVRNKG